VFALGYRLVNVLLATVPQRLLPASQRVIARPLRRIILHVITGTATHAGHLDAARELLDGETWLIQS
jgi:hypothetical protein